MYGFVFSYPFLKSVTILLYTDCRISEFHINLLTYSHSSWRSIYINVLFAFQTTLFSPYVFLLATFSYFLTINSLIYSAYSFIQFLRTFSAFPIRYSTFCIIFLFEFPESVYCLPSLPHIRRRISASTSCTSSHRALFCVRSCLPQPPVHLQRHYSSPFL